MSRNIREEELAVGLALSQSVLIYTSMLSAKQNFTSEEFKKLNSSAETIANFGNYAEKKMYVCFLYHAVEVMKAEPNSNPLTSDNYHQLEIYFRGLCSPLFDRVDSFLETKTNEDSNDPVSLMDYSM